MDTCVTVVRRSTNTPEELVNQYMMIEPFVQEKGWTVIDKLELLDVPRFTMMEQVEQRVLAPLRQRPPNWLVWREHDRIGFKGLDEFGWFCQELRRLGVKLVTANDGLVYDMADPMVMQK